MAELNGIRRKLQKRLFETGQKYDVKNYELVRKSPNNRFVVLSVNPETKEYIIRIFNPIKGVWDERSGFTSNDKDEAVVRWSKVG